MLFSYNWLKEYVKKLPRPEKLAQTLTMKAFEVEEVKKARKDYCLDIDVLANRAPDCFSHIGIARECALCLNANFSLPETRIKEDKKIKAPDFLSIIVENKEDCLRYTARVIDDVKVKDSPKWIQERLKTCGLRSINNIVDIANYVMLETGQPLHVFDFNKLEAESSKKKIIVRRAVRGEEIITLDDEKYILDKDILIIADSKGPLAIAGIKGGKKAEIDKNTKRIVLESANFNSALVRQASQKIRLRTDASFRFEHKIDPNLTEKAINRAAGLINKVTGGEIVSEILDINYFKSNPIKINLQVWRVESLLGFKVSKKEIIDILKKLEFKIIKTNSVSIMVEVPSFRLDVSLPEDLIEEIGRIKGYKNIPSIFPIGYLVPPKKNYDVFWEDIAKDGLKEMGFIESYNYSFVNEKDIQFLGFFNPVELENPISSDLKFLRPSLIPNLLKNILSNFRYLDEVKMFELGNIFFNGFKEKRMLTGFIASKSRGEQFYSVKGAIDNLLNTMGIANIWYDDFEQTPEQSNSLIWEKDRSAEIKVDFQEIGFLGEISQKVLDDYKIAGKVIFFDVDFEKLSKIALEEREYQPVSQYPPAIRDIAVLVPFEVKVIDAMNKINLAGGDLVADVDLFDIYKGEGLPDGKKNLAFHIIFQSKNKTLGLEEINALQDKIIKALESNPEWEVRK